MKHHSQIQHHNVINDWLTITNRVTNIRANEHSQPLINIEQKTRNQHDELSARATSTVRLTTRASNNHGHNTKATST